jgi:hypothetical protein
VGTNAFSGFTSNRIVPTSFSPRISPIYPKSLNSKTATNENSQSYVKCIAAT